MGHVRRCLHAGGMANAWAFLATAAAPAKFWVTTWNGGPSRLGYCRQLSGTPDPLGWVTADAHLTSLRTSLPQSRAQFLALPRLPHRFSLKNWVQQSRRCSRISSLFLKMCPHRVSVYHQLPQYSTRVQVSFPFHVVYPKNINQAGAYPCLRHST